jgi:hypothetical protein
VSVLTLKTVAATTNTTAAICNASFCASLPNGYYALASCYKYYCGCNPELPATPATQHKCPIVNGVQTVYDPTRVQCFAPSTNYCVPAVCNASFCASLPNGYYALAACYEYYCGCNPELPATPATQHPCPIINGVQYFYDPLRVQCFPSSTSYCPTSG